MSNKPKGLNIPWIAIILALVFGAWPIALFLIILREVPIGKSAEGKKVQNSTVGTPAASSARNAEAGNPRVSPMQKKSPKPTVFRVLAIVLYSLGGLMLFASIASIPEGIGEVLQNAVMGLWFLCSGGVCHIVSSTFRRRERDRIRYLTLIGNRQSFSLNTLSSATGYRIGKIKRDLQGMIDEGYFGYRAYIDMAGLCFMRYPGARPDGVTQPYGEYSRTMHAVGMDLSGSEVHEKQKRAAAPESKGELSEFDLFLQKLRRMDEEIRDEAVSCRIRNIESITGSIFSYVKDKPDKMPQLRSFMSYYLPTTVKLLQSYSRIERVGVVGQNTQESKDNIERILARLEAGFKQQMDQLFDTENLDITSDIEVLEQMMKRDGLRETDDFGLYTARTGEAEYSDSFSDDIENSDGGAATQRKDN